VLESATYVHWLTDFVERLRPEQVLHRITGDAPVEHRLAPHWTQPGRNGKPRPLHKNAVRDQLEAELTLRGTRQGSYWGK
nr:hypothetical protein [Planctomycetota bacterium]